MSIKSTASELREAAVDVRAERRDPRDTADWMLAMARELEQHVCQRRHPTVPPAPGDPLKD